MTGLEKMKSQILDEAQKNADEILEEAKKEAVEIREAAQEEAQAECTRILERSRAEVKNAEERSVSSCALQKRKVLLETKQEIIAQVLEKAYNTLAEADEETYFRIIRKMIGKYAASQAGEICFSKKIWSECLRALKRKFRGLPKRMEGPWSFQRKPEI